MAFDFTVLDEMMKNEKREKAERFRILNQSVQKGQIVFAGSSLMEQFPVYEFLLDDKLPYIIYNRGIGGSVTAEYKQNLDVCIYELEPKAVFLNIGTNDLNEPSCTPEELSRRYEQIVDDIQAHLPNVQLYMLAFYPVNPEVADNPMMQEVFKSRTNEKISACNALLRSLAEKKGATWLDLNEDITDENGCLRKDITIEGMHMYANGYRLIWKKLLPVLKELA